MWAELRGDALGEAFGEVRGEGFGEGLSQDLDLGSGFESERRGFGVDDPTSV